MACRARHHRQIPERHARPSRGVPVSIIWFVPFTAAATWLLLRTRAGNWIFAAGGDANAARNSGVPVDRVKTSLFMLTACAATLVAVLTVLDAGSTDARRGLQKEFEAIIAAVIGGCLLTGGYGSAIGAFFGAIIFGMVSIGLTYTRLRFGLVPGVPRRDAAARGAVQQLHPQKRDGRTLMATSTSADRRPQPRQAFRLRHRAVGHLHDGARRRGPCACWATTAPASRR